MARPEHLADYNEPPLEEVVVGVQFDPPPGYSSVRAKDVWELFKDCGFPIVQEQLPLDPFFETFGGSNPPSSVQFKFGPPPLRSRLWFISEKQGRLIQFQEDRLLLNWRRYPNGEDYPRFEGVANSFETYLGLLERFFRTSLEANLNINQSEISYINIIPVEKYSDAGDWFRFWGLENINMENLNVLFREVINDSQGKPCARLVSELQSVVTKDGKEKAFRLSYTYRGKPAGNAISDAMPFIFAGREKIVTRFTEFTTEKAHSIWRRTV